MPANLPPEILKLLEKASETSDPREKMKILFEIVVKTPKHKGTENFLKDIKKKIAKLRNELEKRKKKKSARKVGIKREAPIVISIVGVENTGKSTFLNKYAGTNLKATEIPFETSEPVVGIVKYKDINIQFIEIPSFYEGIHKKGEFFSAIRISDLVLIFLTPERDILEQARLIKEELEKSKIILGKKKEIEIKRKERGGIEIFGIENFEGDEKDVEEILKSFGIHNATVIFKEKCSVEDLIRVLDKSYCFKKFLIVLNKCDLKEIRGILNISVKEGRNIEKMFEEIWRILEIKRIYTKKPGKEPERKPIVFKGKVTVRDVCEGIHADLLKNFRFARIWGPSAKYPGQVVGLEYELSDGDIVEIH